jgi:hypothetical protein
MKNIFFLLLLNLLFVSLLYGQNNIPMTIKRKQWLLLLINMRRRGKKGIRLC